MRFLTRVIRKGKGVVRETKRVGKTRFSEAKRDGAADECNANRGGGGEEEEEENSGSLMSGFLAVEIN